MEENLGSTQESSTILFVDDDQELLNVVSNLMANWGYHVECADSAKSALELMGECRPDLIVSDIMMPEQDGISLLRELQNTPLFAGTPLIFLTAKSEKNQILDAKRLGCADFLSKPFEPEELQAAIEGNLRSSHLRGSPTSQTKLLQTLSHEFRTPLVAINTGADLLIDCGEEMKEELTQRVVGSIKRGGQRLNRLVEDFVTMQRLESGIVAKSQPSLMSDESALSIAKEAIESGQAHLQEMGIVREMQLICNEESLVINVCRPQIISCLVRLLDNANKFSEPDTEINLYLFRSNGRAVFAVEDFGMGMKQSMWSEALKAFSQLNRDFYEQQGAGLGLAIANEFSILNDGRLHLQNEDRDIGSLVTLSFPLVSKLSEQ